MARKLFYERKAQIADSFNGSIRLWKNSDRNPTLPGNMHTGTFANFDWNIILSGQCSYSLKGDSLIMTHVAGINTYSYKLKKVNWYWVGRRGA